VTENKYGGAPNGAAGNTLFEFNTAHNQTELKRTVEDTQSRIETHQREIEDLKTE